MMFLEHLQFSQHTSENKFELKDCITGNAKRQKIHITFSRQIKTLELKEGLCEPAVDKKVVHIFTWHGTTVITCLDYDNNMEEQLKNFAV